MGLCHHTEVRIQVVWSLCWEPESGRSAQSSSSGTDVTCSRTPQPTRPEISNHAFGSWSVSPADDVMWIVQCRHTLHNTEDFCLTFYNTFAIYVYDIQWYNNHVKCKVVHIQVMEAYRGSGGMVAFILNLRTGWRQVVSPTSQPLYLWEKTLGTYWIEM